MKPLEFWSGLRMRKIATKNRLMQLSSSALEAVRSSEDQPAFDAFAAESMSRRTAR
jgi:hypothetical protein